jgi:ribonuclease HI
MGRSSNNKVELLALKLVLRVAVDKQVQKLQVMGDSLLVEWMKGEGNQKIFLLGPFFRRS